MDNENYTVIHELIINRQSFIKTSLRQFQDAVVNFCIDKNTFQKYENYFESLSLEQQFDFNDCVSNSLDKLKKDFKDMEGFYLKCKDNCISMTSQDVIQNSIDDHVSSNVILFRPKLHPCLESCVKIYDALTRNYLDYMVKDYGIYPELIRDIGKFN